MPAHARSASRRATPVRVWSAGCASGQEAYTIAMLLAEAMGWEAFRERVKIYATDVDEEALDPGAPGELLARRRSRCSTPSCCERYFELINGRYVFRSDLRRAVIFGRHDLMQDAPISRLDLLVCRNTLMYFNAETQARILGALPFRPERRRQRQRHAVPRPRRDAAHPRQPVHAARPEVPRLRQGAARAARAPLLPVAPAANDGDDEPDNPRLRDLALEESPVPRIVVDAERHAGASPTQRARVLFSINPKDIGRPLQDLEISYRPAELRSLIEQAYAERRAVTLTSVERRFPDGEVQYLDVVVAPLFDDGQKPLGAAVSFIDVTRATRLQEELRRSQEEVQTANEELQSSNEELETTNEELQSSNEELETTNEELQSTNEELETMNEELQSTNEELQTVNEELRTRSEELNHLNAFFESVLGEPALRRRGGEQQPRRPDVEPPRRGPVGPARRRGAGQRPAQPRHRPAGGRAAHRDPPLPGRRDRPPGSAARRHQPPRQENPMPRHLHARSSPAARSAKA